MKTLPALAHLTARIQPLRRIWLLLAFFLTLAAAGRADTVLVAPGAVWKFLDNGSNQGTAWREAAFNDAWASGPAELGYGDGGEATLIGYGPSATAKYITTYFRTTFAVADPTAFTSLRLRLLRDDGAVVYLNGVEVRRDNLPSGTISHTTLAPVAVGNADETTFFQTTIPTTGLVAGANVLAVEVHQQSGTSSDVSFDLELIGVTSAPGTPVVTRGPYLQKATPTALVVRWRTDLAANSFVRYGPDPANLNLTASNAASVTEHEVALSGLSPDTQYYYSVGTSAAPIASGSEYTFFTPPPVGSTQPTRIWVLGDSGTANADAAAVRNAYTTFAGARYTDVWLMLGDNAYNNGTDAEFQAAVFDMYPAMLRQTALWSTLGNHEYYTSQGAPYFQIHTFPTQAEAGGAVSGTEKYYAFDHGNIHFVCLDSMASDRTATGPMATWLQNDLEATNQTWIVAFFHHPAYTKGSHNSDTETELVQMRQNLLPLLEAGGVDLVLSGHSHSYERSYFINGHYGVSSTFTPAMKLDGGNGSETGTGAYTKPGGLAANQGAVYAVAGSSGKATTWWGGSTADTNPTPHPVMFASLLRLGSMVIDVAGNRMDVKFLRSTGSVDDSFTILKNVANTPPQVAISSPAEGAVFDGPSAITVTAAASDSDTGGSVTQVDFYAGAALIGSASAAPFAVTWNVPPAGAHALTAAATDDRGATSVSAPVNITVTQPAPPMPPTGLSATAGDGAVTLSWTASAGVTGYNVKRATVSGGPYAIIAAGIAATTFTDTAAQNGVAWFYVVSAINDGGESANSNQAVAVNNAAPMVSLTSPAEGATFTAPATIAVTAAASDDAAVTRVEFYAGDALIGSDTTSPYATTWSGVAAGQYALTAVATDNLGATTASAPVNVTVNQPHAPAAPTGLTATAGDAQVALAWAASAGADSYNVKRALSSGGPFATIAAPVAASFVDATAANDTAYFYVVSALNAGGESPASNEASATPRAPGVPAPWLTQDIGAVAAAGSAVESEGTFTVKGSGADLYGSSDEFRYVYQAASGDCEITARVASIQNTSAWAKAGVMIRSTLAANAVNAAVVVTPSNGIAFQRRTSAGKNTSRTTSNGLTAPYWVRLTRTGNSFRAYHSANGATWTQIGSTTTIAMGATVYIGLPVTSRSDGTLCTATFTNVTATP